MTHMVMMKYEIETATRRHIQGEILCLECMLPEHHKVKDDPLISFKSTSDTYAMYMHQAMK